MVHMLNQIPGIDCDLPDGAFYTFPSCENLFGKITANGDIINNDTDLATFLIEKAGVASVPGSAFGLPGHIRFSYATDTPSIQEGCKRIQYACTTLLKQPKRQLSLKKIKQKMLRILWITGFVKVADTMIEQGLM